MSLAATAATCLPSLKLTGVPEGTKSFAIILFDPDAPTGPPPNGRRGFWHWITFNIPASTTSIPKNAGDVKAKLMPDGVIQSRNSYGFDGFGGTCPPKGDKPHHYVLTVYAVDEDKLQFSKDDMTSPKVSATRRISIPRPPPRLTGPTAVPSKRPSPRRTLAL